MSNEDLGLDPEPCPGCGQLIDCTASICPHCQYNLDLGQPAKKPKEPKQPKEKRTKVKETIITSNKSGGGKSSSGNAAGRYRIMVPALGRISGPDIDFAELHWKKDTPVNDQTLAEWGEDLRFGYAEGAKDSQGVLSNHAIGYLASHADGPHDKVLRENANRIVELLGGDEYKDE